MVNGFDEKARVSRNERPQRFVKLNRTTSIYAHGSSIRVLVALSKTTVRFIYAGNNAETRELKPNTSEAIYPISLFI